MNNPILKSMNTIAKAAIRWYESKGVHAYDDAEGRVYIIVYGDEMVDELHVEVSAHEVILRATATLTNP
jgi:hypothetical protein